LVIWNQFNPDAHRVLPGCDSDASHARRKQKANQDFHLPQILKILTYQYRDYHIGYASHPSPAKQGLT
jgi:hypothetical protein